MTMPEPTWAEIVDSWDNVLRSGLVDRVEHRVSDRDATRRTVFALWASESTTVRVKFVGDPITYEFSTCDASLVLRRQVKRPAHRAAEGAVSRG